MAQEGNKEKTEKKKDGQIAAISFVALLTVLLFIVEIYEIINDPNNLIAIGTLGGFILVAVYVETFLIHRLSVRKGKEQEEAYNNVYRSEKASYLLMRKYFDQMDQKIETIEKKSGIPYKELVKAQKAFAKVQINRNNENAEALLHSNERMLRRLIEFQNTLKGLNSGGLSEQDKAAFTDGNKDILQKQQEILAVLKELEFSIKNEITESTNKMASIQAQMPQMDLSGIQTPQLEMPEAQFQMPEIEPEMQLEMPGVEPGTPFQMPEIEPEMQFQMPEIEPEMQLEMPGVESETPFQMPEIESEIGPEAQFQMPEIEPEMQLEVPEEEPEMQLEVPEEEPEMQFKMPEAEPEAQFQMPEIELPELEQGMDLPGTQTPEMEMPQFEMPPLDSFGIENESSGHKGSVPKMENSSESDLDELLRGMNNGKASKAVSTVAPAPVTEEPELAPIAEEPELSSLLQPLKDTSSLESGNDQLQQEPVIEELEPDVMVDNLDIGSLMDESKTELTFEKDGPFVDNLDLDSILGDADFMIDNLDSVPLTNETGGKTKSKQDDEFLIEPIIEKPVKKQKEGSGDLSDPGHVMNADEIAALIANTDLLSEPEEQKEEVDDASDPVHIMNADEIAALIANL